MRQSENNSEGAERGPKVRTRRDNVLSFREGHVYMALKMLSPCDQNQGPDSAPFPRVVFLVDGKYVRMPADENLLRRLGTFMLRVSELLDGIEVPEKELDLEGARRKMRGYLEQSAPIPSSTQEHTARGRELTN